MTKIEEENCGAENRGISTSLFIANTPKVNTIKKKKDIKKEPTIHLISLE